MTANPCPPCSGNCNQGRNCSTRQACELPIDEEPMKDLTLAIFAALFGVLAFALLVSGAMFVFQNWPLIAAAIRLALS